mmetsp:Transcript_23090/g.64218  ORF Transcript_23090/g.64218 Transcript_23090/m.64218 type:complete len:104 (-) Transcript_23090:180-491(-)|eukprot:CAMPEP_0168745260 /NCGR_PEP_ID=MMETSP0724-20121128/14520_1 /TAXON_ID=265536 /ORGANISM="Amphiprora sp., Strain CCMP467" /LENGTH=103 /DNA_ID=CAMNT_0008792955 /DNA_START=22 /DNA_END=333 /DNA_ORIENTATION=-
MNPSSYFRTATSAGLRSTAQARGMAATTSSSSTMERQQQQQPNRLTKYFAAMKEHCPDAIRTYAQCVTTANDNERLNKGSCQAEFDAVKTCLRQVRSGGDANY